MSFFFLSRVCGVSGRHDDKFLSISQIMITSVENISRLVSCKAALENTDIQSSDLHLTKNECIIYSCEKLNSVFHF